MAGCHIGFLAICRIRRRQITLDAVIDSCLPLLKFAWGKVLVVGVDRLKLAAVDRNDCVGEQTKLTSQHDELATNTTNALPVFACEVRNCLEMRSKMPRQHLHWPTRFLPHSRHLCRASLAKQPDRFAITPLGALRAEKPTPYRHIHKPTPQCLGQVVDARFLRISAAANIP